MLAAVHCIRMSYTTDPGKNDSRPTATPPSQQYRDCFMCRLTGSAVLGVVSAGAFHEAWKLAYPDKNNSSSSNATQSAPIRGDQIRPQNWRSMLAGFVRAMEAFPQQRQSHSAISTSTQSSAVKTASGTALSQSPRPTGRIAFLFAAGTAFAGGAVWRAVMPANKAVADSEDN